MTTRHAGYIVTLDDDIREDDAEPTISALRQIKGVLSVTPVENNLELRMATERVRREYVTKLLDVVREWNKL